MGIHTPHCPLSHNGFNAAAVVAAAGSALCRCPLVVFAETASLLIVCSVLCMPIRLRSDSSQFALLKCATQLWKCDIRRRGHRARSFWSNAEVRNDGSRHKAVTNMTFILYIIKDIIWILILISKQLANIFDNICAAGLFGEGGVLPSEAAGQYASCSWSFMASI